MAYLYLINSKLNSKQYLDIESELGLENVAFVDNELVYCQSISILRIQPNELLKVRSLLEQTQLDYIFSEQPLLLPKLVVFDMDSTLIPIEVIDELASYAEKKKQVAKITEQAMQGELDFNQSLVQRVTCLEGLAHSVIDDLANNLQFNPGVKEFCYYLLQNKAEVAIASGGFEPFARALQEKINFKFVRANRLEIINSQLTGKVLGTIINAEEKAKAVLDWCRDLNITTQESMAIGDGANDLLMLDVAGLGLAYRAKPKVNQRVHSALKHSSMAALVDLFELAKKYG